MSSCLLCLFGGIPLLNSTLGTPRDPVGVCTKCNSLSCGWHGRRLTRGEFFCLICDENKLVASAAWRQFDSQGGWRRIRGQPVEGHNVDDPALDLAQALAALFATADGYASPAAVGTLRQWLQERPSDNNLFNRALADAVDWALRVLTGWFTTRQGNGPGEMVNGHYDQRSIVVFWSRLDAEGRRLLVGQAAPGPTTGHHDRRRS